jgi:transcriptional regulator GlxA family with amidase domain
MPGVMLVKQKVADVAQWNRVFRDPELDEVRRSHGLAVTGTYLDGEDADTIIVVMAMDDMDRARAFAASTTLASARERAGALGSPAGVWYGPAPVG